MRPAPIPDDRIIPGSRRIVVGPPGNNLDSTIPPVEACLEQLTHGMALSVRCVLDPEDIDNLMRGEAVWITFIGQMPPFAVRVGP